ncbi:GxxExxY protein [candidate division BRC1 bacterium SM23_51]|nr:MAG: GxxExxY protein [candidate division BRC1 bacterium SM23_51]
MNADARRLNQITEKIIGCTYTVANALGPGFLEKVYENALSHELRKSDLKVEQQKNIQVYYDDIVVGEYAADLLVEGSALVELKAAKALDEIHMAQCLNYRKATGLRICRLLNFGTPRVEVKRLVNQF